MEKKAPLRRELLARRDALPGREERSRAIQRQVLALPEYRRARRLLLYLSQGSEVDTWPLLDRALAQGRAVYAPRCLDGQGNMAFYRVFSREDLAPGRFGLWEPLQERCPLLTEWEGALCLLPGIAFDREGFRLGYGKGYYDRFLSSYQGVKIGICYHKCIAYHLPKGRYDVPVDFLVTEKSIRKIKRTDELEARK